MTKTEVHELVAKLTSSSLTRKTREKHWKLLRDELRNELKRGMFVDSYYEVCISASELVAFFVGDLKEYTSD